MSEMTVALYVRQMLMAVAFLHSKGIVHGDLRPRNVMLSSKLPDAFVREFEISSNVVLLSKRPDAFVRGINIMIYGRVWEKVIFN
jgi:serine/threonine protein kinase